VYSKAVTSLNFWKQLYFAEDSAIQKVCADGLRVTRSDT